MTITVLDRSNYYRGLLLLVRKDLTITDREFELLMHVGAALGFDPEFCESSIRWALENKYIDTSPPHFSTPELARKFLKDGLTIASSDSQIHAAEDAWLCATAAANNIDEVWYKTEKQNLLDLQAEPESLEVDHLNVE